VVGAARGQLAVAAFLLPLVSWMKGAMGGRGGRTPHAAHWGLMWPHVFPGPSLCCFAPHCAMMHRDGGGGALGAPGHPMPREGAPPWRCPCPLQSRLTPAPADDTMAPTALIVHGLHVRVCACTLCPCGWQIRSADNNVMYEVIGGVDDEFAVVAKITGEVSLCFENQQDTPTSKEEKHVSFNTHVGSESFLKRAASVKDAEVRCGEGRGDVDTAATGCTHACVAWRGAADRPVARGHEHWDKALPSCTGGRVCGSARPSFLQCDSVVAAACGRVVACCRLRCVACSFSCGSLATCGAAS
jgi:hypothetical protein